MYTHKNMQTLTHTGTEKKKNETHTHTHTHIYLSIYIYIYDYFLLFALAWYGLAMMIFDLFLNVGFVNIRL